jgi:hypothetical protein
VSHAAALRFLKGVTLWEKEARSKKAVRTEIQCYRGTGVEGLFNLVVGDLKL